MGVSVPPRGENVTTSTLPPTELLTDEENVAATYRQLTLFIEEYVERSDANGVVVGMSGGVDSTLAASLAVDALGPDRVFGLLLPCNLTAEAGSHDALTVAEALGIDYREIHLQPLVRCFEDLLVGDEDRDERIRALGNATARLRMTCLYYAANTRSKLVLGTGNRSERLLGYFTKHGDGGCDLLPLANLYKTEVRALARHVGLPCRIVEKPSTAGLWAEQTDEDELGASYDRIDAVLHYVVDRRYRAETVAEELDIPIETVWEIVNGHVETHHKRRHPATPGRERTE
ncbi:NAD+ synthetase [Haladaptatus paucihalophilus DX253]|uniref:NH(3)-dependent NAD(+) synthetase n=1 Tax=Haladaptatus paucihalophilus DX253 TaxID=797209 RepID=E7QV42_HALPU|nr:NAD+ synthetase [Haladaptatus paucihalophilus DX253]SHL24632.1 NAD+ synthase [Haladaptatus paucihalophilus DX253]